MTKLIPFAICYDFDGTLAPGNMQERAFIPNVGMTPENFWAEVKARCREHDADEILMYMWLMLEKAEAQHVPVRKDDFNKYGEQLPLFSGVIEWFGRINEYGLASGLEVTHHVISSGIREIVYGTAIRAYFKNIYASSFAFDHNGVARWPALALNYTTKTQYLFRINKGAEHVYDNTRINKFVPHAERPIPFQNMVYLGDGETDVPCFRLVKEQGGHSVAVHEAGNSLFKDRCVQLFKDGRVNFVVPADYNEGQPLDLLIKAIMEKVAAERHLKDSFTPRSDQSAG